MKYEAQLEETQQTLSEHLDAALENATDETTVFHPRQARQMVSDLPALVAAKSDVRAE